MKRTRRWSTAGFTLIEILVAATVMLVMAGSLIAALKGLRGVTEAGSVESKLQEAGEKAMLRIVSDMKLSGFVEEDFGAGPQKFPLFFDEGDPSQVYTWLPAQGQPVPDVPAVSMAAHFHPPAVKQAQPGDPDFGINREIVLLQPADADGDGIPDIDPNGELVWGASQISYVVVTRPDGNNYLERRVDGIAPNVVALNVERITFDDMYSDGTVPFNVVRIQLFLRQADANGQVHRYITRARIRLRNASIVTP